MYGPEALLRTIEYNSCGCNLRLSEVRSGSFGVDVEPVWGPTSQTPKIDHFWVRGGVLFLVHKKKLCIKERSPDPGSSKHGPKRIGHLSGTVAIQLGTAGWLDVEPRFLKMFMDFSLLSGP